MKRLAFLIVALCALLLTPCIPAEATQWCCENRGDVDDSDGLTPVDISDVVYLVSYMFAGGPPPPCIEQANLDMSTDSDPITISDLAYLADYLFGGGPPPPPCMPFTIIYVDFGDTVMLNDYGFGVTFNYLLSDDRCPEGDSCSETGYAMISVEMIGTNSCLYGLVLPIADDPAAESETSMLPAIACGYRFVLKSLSPYPEPDASIPVERYRAVIQVWPQIPADGSSMDIEPTELDWAATFWDDVNGTPYYTADNAVITGGDSLKVDFSYKGGGYAPHYFSMFWYPAGFSDDTPRQVYLYAFDYQIFWDLPFRDLQRTVTYSLESIAELYRQTYGTLEPIEIHLEDHVIIWDPTQ